MSFTVGPDVLFAATRATRRNIPDRHKFGFSGVPRRSGRGFSDG
jgi:hypothetical protein